MSNPSRDAMMRYCKAQAQINSVTKENTEKQKEINERIRGPFTVARRTRRAGVRVLRVPLDRRNRCTSA